MGRRLPTLITARPRAGSDARALQVSVIVVNYNGKAYLEDCLGSLERQTLPAQEWETILVDNASTDGSVDYVRAHFPGVRIVALSRNRGFAGGNNAGFQHARGDWIALLNNDTVADPRWLEALLEGRQTEPAVGALASKILFKEDPSTINSVGLNLYRDGRGGDRGFRQRDQGQFDASVEVFGASGAGMLLRRALLDDVGGFDERFFMYYEDLDLSWRARLRGWSIRSAPAAIVQHVHCGTSGEWSPFFLLHVERNRVFVNLKNAPARLAVRSLAVFGARALRKWFRVLSGRECRPLDRQLAWAYVPAGTSLLAGMPAMLWQRFVNRFVRRRVADRDFAHLISVPPAADQRANMRSTAA
jgi:GT2 family glycosyltransferase